VTRTDFKPTMLSWKIGHVLHLFGKGEHFGSVRVIELMLVGVYLLVRELCVYIYFSQIVERAPEM
jgi:hypothetical protein